MTERIKLSPSYIEAMEGVLNGEKWRRKSWEGTIKNFIVTGEYTPYLNKDYEVEIDEVETEIRQIISNYLATNDDMMVDDWERID